MEQLTPLPRPGDPRNMEPWALPAWQSWTPGQGGEPGGASPSMADTPAALHVGELRPEESPEPEGARSPGAVGGIEPRRTETGLPSSGPGALGSRPSCQRLEDEELEASPKVREVDGGGLRTGGSHHALQLGHDLQLRCLPLFSCLCLWVHLCACLSSLLWAGISVAPFFFFFWPSVCPSASLLLYLESSAFPLPL